MTNSFIYTSDAFRDCVYFEKDVLTPISTLIESVDGAVERYLLDCEAASFIGMEEGIIEFPVMEDGKNIFQSIGEAVETLLKKLGDMLNKLMDKISSAFPEGKRKEKEESLKRAWAAHPELAESFIKGISDGSIKYSEYENIDKMVDDAMKIIKDLETGRIEAKTGVDKLNDVITNFNEKLTPAADLLNTVGGASRNILNVVGFKNKIEDEFFKHQKNQRKKEYFWAESRKETYEENKDAYMTARTWRLKIAEKYASEYSRTGALLTKALVNLSSTADKFGGKKVAASWMKLDDRDKGRPGAKEALIHAQKANSVDSAYKPKILHGKGVNRDENS